MLTEPKDHQQRKARNPSLGANNDKNHCRLTKASDNQPLSEDKLDNLDKDTLTHNPNKPKYFSMQIVNNPSKRDSRAFEKAQRVITQCIQTSYIAFIRKIHSENRDYTKKRTSKL